MTCRLILVSAPERPAYEFEGEVLSIGRAKDNSIVLADALVSRRHAELRKRGPGFIIVDMGSKNGVYVNNLKVSQEDLAHGDLILIGDAKLVFDSPIK